MATSVFTPPPPNIANNDPVFNRWLHDLTSELIAFAAASETATATNAAAIAAISSGPQLFSGIGIPAFTLGVNGDWYARTAAPFGVYVKAVGSWVKVA